jgi:hypothetical protein
MGQALSGGVLGKGAQAVGATGKAVTAVETVPFFASSYYEMRDQFDDPKFNNVSDLQKVLFSAVYGTASGILEKYGLTKSISKTPFGKNLTNTILASAIKGLPKDASEKMIKEAIEASVVNRIKSAGVSSLGAFTVEAATESTQKATELALQEAFDGLNGNNYFDNGTGWEMLSDVIYEGYLGGLGGTMMNVAANGARIATDGISKVLNKEQEGILDIMTQTEGMSESFDTYLKGLVVSGDITSSEASVMSKGFREVKAGFDKIPSDIPVDKKTQAFDLIVERSKIEKEIQGKEDNLVVAQKERIKEINVELQNISRDAVQEQVPIQSEAEVGEEVEGGKPEAEPEVVTEEGKEINNKSVDELEKRQSELEDSPFDSKEREEYNAIDKELESREWSSVLNSTLEDIPSIVDSIMKKDKEMPNGYGSYMDKSDARQTKEVADKYSLEVSKNEARKDFKDAFFGNPSTWYADAIKLRESARVYIEQGGSMKELLSSISNEFKGDGFTEQDAASVIDRKLNEVKARNTQTFNQPSQQSTAVETAVDVDVDAEVTKLDDLIKGSDIKFKKGEQAPTETEVDSVVEEMNTMSEDVSNFDVPSDLTTKNKTNVSSLLQRFGDKLKSAFKGGIIKNISEYNGIPMIFTISDQLTSGDVKNEFTGNTIDVNGGIGFNLTDGNEGSAWANTDVKEAEAMLARAQDVYSKNKDLFDRLWSEGKLPNGQIPMAIVKMGQDSIQTNEALFRFAADTIRSKFSEEERTKSLEGLIEDISSVKPDSKVISFIKENNFKTIDELLDNMNKLKPIGERTNVTRFLFTGGIQLGKETKAGKPRSKSGLALVGDKDPSFYKYIHLQTINNAIQDESTKSIPSNHIIGITGVDVLNPEVTQPKHRNYPYGVKGGLIGILESPVHAADIFPEMYSKSFYLNKEDKAGKLPSPSKAVDQSVAASGPVAGIKAFRGAKLSTKMTDLQKLLGKLRLAFPSVTVVDTQEEFENTLNNPEVKQFVKDGEVVYGFTKDGKVYLNPKLANSNTAIHEFAHVWMNFLKENNSELLKKGYSLLEGTDILKRKIAELGDVELAREEAMAELIANKGESLIEAGVKSKFKNWLNAVFSYVKTKFKAFDKLTPEELQNLSLNEFVDGSLASILGGKEVTSKEVKTMGVMFSKDDPISKVLSVARDNGISDAAIKKYLASKGFSEKDIKDAFSKSKKEIDEVVAKAKEKYDLSIERGNTEQKAQESAMSDLKKNDWYVNANDTQREEAVRELTSSLGGKIKKAPSVAKVLGKPKPDKVTFNAATLRNEFIKARATAARESQADMKQKQKALVAVVAEFRKLGKITAKQAVAMNRALVNLNINDPVMVNRFVDYAQRIFEDADYRERLNNAKAVQKRIKKASKSDSNQAHVSQVAKEFAKINPAIVGDVDAYIEMANELYAAVATSRVGKIKKAVDLTAVNEYVDKKLEEQEKYMQEELMEAYQDLGILEEGMSYKEMKALLTELNSPESKETKNAEALKYLQARFKNQKLTLRFVEELDARQREIISKLAKIDLSEVSIKDAIKVVEFMDNFLLNGITDGVESLTAVYEGDKGAKSIKAKGITARSMKTFGKKSSPETMKISNGRFWSQQMMSFVTLNDLLFRGVRRAGEVLTQMGFYDFTNGVNRANKIWNNTMDAYAKEFSDKKPNGEAFNTAKNIYERGMYAFLSRTVIGTEVEQAVEMRRKVDLIKESIKRLKKDGDPKQRQMADVYSELFDKLGLDKDNVTIDDVSSKVDAINKSAVDWWVNEWSKHYSDLSDVSSSVYNTVLEKDVNYTPDSYAKISKTAETVDEILENEGGAFAASLDYVYDKKSGSLMESKKVKGMADGRFVNLDFDMVNSKAVKAALVDINTAAATRKIKGFIGSDAFSEIIEDKYDRDIYEAKLKSYIFRSRNKMKGISDKDSTMEAVEGISRVWAKLGTARVLGQLAQPIKQTVPMIMSTMLNTGMSMRLINPFSDKAKNDWINRSGFAIANRGAESVTAIETAHKALDKALEGNMIVKGGKSVWKAIDTASDVMLKYTIQMPDVWIARSAFLSYYIQDLKRQGIDTDNIDWDTHETNTEAGNYAQHMVDRQQNVSDTNLAGEVFASEDPLKKLMRNVFLPYASFVINQKARVFSDLATIGGRSRGATWQDIWTASKSLAGLTVEMFMYQAIGVAIRLLLMQLAAEIIGIDLDDEDEEKFWDNQIKYAGKQVIVDILSPAPMADYYFVEGINKVIEANVALSDSDKKDLIKAENEAREFKGEDAMTEIQEQDFLAKKERELQESMQLMNESIQSFGTLSVLSGKMGEFNQLLDLVNNGKYTFEYKGNEITKYVMEKDRAGAKKMVAPMSAFMIGLMFAEVANINRYVMKQTGKKAGLTEKQWEAYNELEIKNPNSVEEFLIRNMQGTKSQKAAERIKEELDWIERNGGLDNEKQRELYIKIYERDGSVNRSDMEKIKGAE